MSFADFNFGKFVYENSNRSLTSNLRRVYNSSGLLSAGATAGGIAAAAISVPEIVPLLSGIALTGAAIHGGKQIYEGIKGLF